MTTTTYNDNVEILGSQDITQLLVKGYTTQDEPLQEWQDSSGIVLAQITGDGRLELQGEVSGAISQPVDWSTHELEISGSGAVSSNHAALRGQILYTSTGDADNAAFRGGDFLASNEEGSGSHPVGRVVGVHGEASNANGAYADNIIGVEALVSNAASGDVAHAAAFEVVTPANAGTIDTLYGLYVPTLNQGSVNYPIYVEGGEVYLGGGLEVRGGAFDVYGPGSIYWSAANNWSNGWSVLKRGQTGDASGAVLNTAELGYNSFYGWNSSEYKRGAFILSQATEDWDSSNWGASLQFWTAPNGTGSEALRLKIDQDGTAYFYDDLNVAGDVSISGAVTSNLYLENELWVTDGDRDGWFWFRSSDNLVLAKVTGGAWQQSVLAVTYNGGDVTFYSDAHFNADIELTQTTTPASSLTWDDVGTPNGYLKVFIGATEVAIPYWNA